MVIAMTAHGASSSSSSSKVWKYDVFLSFRGEDTRKGFTGHLHQALEGKCYKTFIDEDDLKRGEEIKPELLRAIEESRISIIVFSKRYADSSWCLDELVKIMECRSKLEQHVLPIFYDVEASEIRKQEGSLARVFQKHEENMPRERVEQWREALTKAANLSGYDLKNTENGHEAKLIQKIIYENIWKWLPSTNKLRVAKHPIGINSRVEDIITYLSSGESKDVVMVGIWGMGGLGKTTAAKAIYNQIHPKFESKSFLADVSDTTSKHGLVHLQKKLIFDILDQEFKVSTVDEGIDLIKEKFSHRKVLVIMDNIDKEEQLDAIAGNHDWFGPGSRIIITTRDKHLLQQAEVNKIYPAQKLNEGEALELFSCHAFGYSRPNEGYLQLSEKVVSYCDGLPLALEVLGSSLFKRNIPWWECQLKKLERIPDGKIIKQLRMSFDGLDKTEKATFLNICCFFIGEDKDHVTKLLDVCGFFATVGIGVLHDRCLVTVEYNMLSMHDLLREMARVIISEEYPDHPGKWSRLWNRENVIDVLTNESGTEEVEGLDLQFRDPWSGSSNKRSFSTQAFANMKKLRLLRLYNVELNGEYKLLSKELIWLCWHYFPLQSIPDDFFNQPRLVVLEMQWSNLVQVWEGSKSLHNLKTLDLSNSHSLQKSPDFSQVPNLEELILQRCESLSEIHPSIGHLKRLSLVNLERCEMLSSLPRDFYKLRSVETLLLNNCSKFTELREDIGEMVSLRTLEAGETAIREVPPSILALKNLTRLSLDRVSVELKGEYIYLCWKGCPLKTIRDDIFNQDKLVALDMPCSELVQVWEGSKSLQNLKTLDLSYSYFLQKSPDFSQVPNLEELILQWCESLSEIHPSIGHLKRLSLVNLRHCHKLISLPRDFYKSKSVETLLLNRCRKFREVHEDIGEMISLRTLEAEDTAIREVPPSIVRLKNLTRLSLSGVQSIFNLTRSGVESIHLPHSLHGLNSLRELGLSYCGLADDEIPKDFASLISLQDLNLQGNELRTLPSLSGLSKLETLRLSDCKQLHTITDLPTNLKFLLAHRCPALETMPNFSEMSNMRELNVSDSPKVIEVPGLDKSLNSMTWINMKRCTNLSAHLRKNILQGWTSCGFGGIILHGNHVPDWFEFVNQGAKVTFDIPPSDGRNFKGLTLFCLYHSDRISRLPIFVTNNTQHTELQAYIGRDQYDDYPKRDDYLLQGQLSNNKLNLQGGDKVDIFFPSSFIKKIGVNLVWDKPMKENMHDLDKAGYVFHTLMKENMLDLDNTRIEFDWDSDDNLVWDKLMKENMHDLDGARIEFDWDPDEGGI